MQTLRGVMMIKNKVTFSYSFDIERYKKDNNLDKVDLIPPEKLKDHIEEILIYNLGDEYTEIKVEEVE